MHSYYQKYKFTASSAFTNLSCLLLAASVLSSPPESDLNSVLEDVESSNIPLPPLRLWGLIQMNSLLSPCFIKCLAN